MIESSLVQTLSCRPTEEAAHGPDKKLWMDAEQVDLEWLQESGAFVSDTRLITRRLWSEHSVIHPPATATRGNDYSICQVPSYHVPRA